MAARLISRQKFIPYGFKFNQPEINWQARRNTSFDQVVKDLIRARNANAPARAKYKWATDYDTVANEVDEYNARICLAHGWNEYVSSGTAPSIPKSNPLSQIPGLQSLKDAAAKAKELVAGAKTLMEWKDSEDAAVPAELSESRATVCASCPMNQPGDFTQWFTVPAAELIRRQIQETQAKNLTTSKDAQLNLCTACSCPLRLKVHVPIQWIGKRLAPGVLAKLKAAPNCWIPLELQKQ